MATIRDIVSRAFRKIGVLASDSSLTSGEIAEGVDALNMMMHEWKLSAVDLSYADLDESGTFPLGPEFELGTVYLLAAHLSVDYIVPAAFDADDFFRRVQAAYMVIDVVTLPNALIYVPSQRENLTGQDT